MHFRITFHIILHGLCLEIEFGFFFRLSRGLKRLITSLERWRETYRAAYQIETFFGEVERE